ncbi:hypothetical protein Btru_047940 [Bulinus truncatus]|nr:hypothetical protein Btru_047940 [Bulinus truncatus]
MNPKQDRNNIGQAPLPPPAPRTTAPSPSRNLVELQRRSESMPSFTKRKRMEKSQDEQRWKRTDLQLIHYMSKLKEEYIQRQSDHEQQMRKMKETDATADERDMMAAENQTVSQCCKISIRVLFPINVFICVNAAVRLWLHVLNGHTWCREVPTNSSCHFHPHGPKRKHRGKHRRHYRYIVDPSMYAYLGDRHNRNSTRCRKRHAAASTDESGKTYDSPETSYTSVHEVIVSETSYSMSDASSVFDSSSLDVSGSGNSSYVEHRTNIEYIFLQTTIQQQAQETHSNRLPDVGPPITHPSTSSAKEPPRSMIPVRSPPRTRTSSKLEGLASEDGAGSKRAQRPATKLPRTAELRRAASTNSAKTDMNDGAKLDEQDLRPNQSTGKIENQTQGGYSQVTAQYSGKVQAAESSDDRPRGVDSKQPDEPSAFTAMNTATKEFANLSMAGPSKTPQNDSHGEKKINDIQAKFLGEAMASDFNLLQSSGFKAAGPKDGKQWLQLNTLGKPRTGLTRSSMPELKGLAADKTIAKAKALPKAAVPLTNSSLKRSRWSGLILEDHKETARKTEVPISPMKLSSRRTQLANEDPAHQKKGALRIKASPTRPGSKSFALRHGEEDAPLKETPAEKPEEKSNAPHREQRAAREHTPEKKPLHNVKLSSSRLSAKSNQAPSGKVDVSEEESITDSEEKVAAASIRETPSIIMRMKKPSFATPEPSVKKAASYKMSSPPSSVKSAVAPPKRREDTARPGSGKSKSIKSRSPLKRESPHSRRRSMDKAQESIPSEMLRTASSSGSVSEMFRKGKRDPGKDPGSGRRLAKFKSSLKVVPERSSSQLKVSQEKNDDKRQRRPKPKSNKSVKKVDDDFIQSFSTETKNSVEKKLKAKQPRSNSNKVMSVENRFTQVESWPESSDNEKHKKTHRNVVRKVPKRVTHKTHIEENKVDKKRIHKSAGSRRHRLKGLCPCRLPAVKVLGQKRGKHRRHYRYIVDPSMYAYLGDRHNRNSTRCRKRHAASTDESGKTYDFPETSYTSVHEVIVSETSYSMSDASSVFDSSSLDVSGSGNSSYVEHRTNRVSAACLSLKDSATLSWNMSESNVQIQSYSPAVQKASRENNRSKQKRRGQHQQQHASSEVGRQHHRHKAFIMSKEIRRKCRIPVSVSSIRNQTKPVRQDQPPEGSRHRPAGGRAEPREATDVTRDKKTDTRFAAGVSGEEDEKCRELDAMEAEIDQVLVKLYRSQQEIEMKLEIVEESMNQLKWNRQQALKELHQRAERSAKTGQTSGTKWEATYFDYFMFLTFLALQIIFHVVFIKKM